MLVPYLNNPSAEEALFGSNKIKEEQETMTIQNEDVMLKNNYKSLINKLNRPVHYVRNFIRKKLFVLHIYNIHLVYYPILKKLKYLCLHNKFALLMRRSSE